MISKVVDVTQSPAHSLCFPDGRRLAAPLSTAEALELALLKLLALSFDCAKCGGTGKTFERYELFTMTDNAPRFSATYRQALREGAKVQERARGAVFVRSPCEVCADLRATIKTCEGAQ